MKIFVVEDQADLNRIIVKKLKSEGYETDASLNGREALDKIRKNEYDGIILDIMLPEMSGLEILKKMRADDISTPTLLLTAMGSVEDRVSGLDAGADDYLVKPFDFNELMARVRVMTRRNAGSTDKLLEAGDLTMDVAARIVKRNDREIELTAKEFDILEYLLKHKGEVISREKLSIHVWNYDYDGGSNVIDVYMHHLRKKLDEGCDTKLITTVKGAGYVIR